MNLASRFRSTARNLAERVGYDRRNWLRIEQIRCWEQFLRGLPSDCEVLEVSPAWDRYWQACVRGRYTSVDYPDFDICRDRLDRQFDAIILDQVLEHSEVPAAAVSNVYAMLVRGGCALIGTPFLFRVHRRPRDLWRWTEDGLRELVVANGFERDKVHTQSWGNMACVRAHIGDRIPAMGWGRDLSNDPDYPMMVWCIAER